MTVAPPQFAGWKEQAPTYRYGTLLRFSGAPLALLALCVFAAPHLNLPIQTVAIVSYVVATVMAAGVYFYEVRDVRVEPEGLTLCHGLGALGPTSVSFANIASVRFAVLPRVAMLVLAPRTAGTIPSDATMISVPRGDLGAVRALFAARGIPAADSLKPIVGPILFGIGLAIVALIGVSTILPKVFPNRAFPDTTVTAPRR